MLSVFLNIVVICFIMSLAAVFVIQWGKQLFGAFKNFKKDFKTFFLCLVSLFVSAALSSLGYDAFKEYLPSVTTAIQPVLAFVILGFIQLVWENYNMLKDWVLNLIKKVAEKKAGV